LVKTLVNLNPVTHLAEAVRGLMHGTPDSASITIVLIASAVLIAIFGPLTMFLYRNKNAR
jgi:ABC-2 type transport system permease protein